MQKVTTMPMAAVRALPPEQLDEILREAAKAVKNEKKDRDANRAGSPTVGKAICRAEERLNEAKAAKLIAPGTSLTKYIEGIAGGKGHKLSTHAWACASSFGTFVRTEILPEEEWDHCGANLLELTGQIADAVNGDVTHPAIALTVEEMRERGKNVKNNLREILDTVKPREAMDAEKAAKLLGQIIADGHIHVAIAQVAGHMCYLKDTAATEAYIHWLSASEMMDHALGEDFIAETADAYAEQKAAQQRAAAPIQVLQAGQPAAATAAKAA